MGNAERAEAEALVAERTITGKDIALEGVVGLTTVDTLAARIVSPALADLQAKHPGIIVELVPDPRSLSLSKREADIALRMSRFKGDEVAARRVGALAMGMYASPDMALRIAEGQSRLVTVLDDQAHLPEAEWLRDAFPDALIGFRSTVAKCRFTRPMQAPGFGARPLSCRWGARVNSPVPRQS